MKKLFDAYRAFMVQVVLRKFLIPVALTFCYVVGVGISSVLVRIFLRSRIHAGRRDDVSWWNEAKGNEPDRQKCLRQS